MVLHKAHVSLSIQSRHHPPFPMYVPDVTFLMQIYPIENGSVRLPKKNVDSFGLTVKLTLVWALFNILRNII